MLTVNSEAAFANQVTDLVAVDEGVFALEVRFAGHEVHKIEAAADFSAMELIRAAGLPIQAECGGAGVCATCHCRVPAVWFDRLTAASSEEQDKLDEIPSADDRSRLSCQIRMVPELDGLVLELQPDSLKPGWQGQQFLDAAE
jgi:ferredoxin, 2Fe-2S